MSLKLVDPSNAIDNEPPIVINDWGRARQLQELWTNPMVFSSSLVALFIDAYTTEAIEWHPAAIRLQLEEDVSVRIPQVTLDRLMAGLVILSTNTFYQNLPTFVHICNVMSGDELDAETFDPADPLEMAWSVTEAMMLYPDVGPDPFSDEIKAYMGATLDQYGYSKPPRSLGMATSLPSGVIDIESVEDDPVMMQAYLKTQVDKSREVDLIVEDSIGRLTDQLASLPIVNRIERN